jgi:hypothetical protein
VERKMDETDATKLYIYENAKRRLELLGITTVIGDTIRMQNKTGMTVGLPHTAGEMDAMVSILVSIILGQVPGFTVSKEVKEKFDAEY